MLSKAHNICYTTLIGSAEAHRNRDPVTAGVLTWVINDGEIPEDKELIITGWVKLNSMRKKF